MIHLSPSDPILEPISSSSSLLYFQAQKLTILKGNIYRGVGFSEIAIFDAQEAIIRDFYVSLDQNFFVESIHSSFECLKERLIE